MDAGGLEVLANLLETDNIKCKIGSLKILKDITIHPSIRKSITLMGGIELMITTLSDPNKELQFLSSETLANLAKFRKARKIVRKNNGIPKLIDLLEFDMSNINISKISPDCSDKELPMELRVAKGSAFALWSLSKSKKNKHVIKRSGGLPLIANLFKFKHISLLIPVVGTIQECASEKAFRMVIQSEGMIEHLVKNLKTTSPELKMLCASAIFKMAEENDSRQIVKLHGGLKLLVELISESTNHNNKELMAAVTGAIWKCATTDDNVEIFGDLGLMPILIKILKENSEALDDLQFNTLKINVLTNVVGALSECADNAVNRESISEGEGLSPLIKLIGTNHSELLVNVSSALGSCAQDKDTLQTIHQKDGVRLLWSLLKNPSEKVQASAAWALSPCIKNAANSGDMVRSFVGGLELMCGLLESKDQQVLAAVCFAIANIAKDKENLAVITDHGVIEKLSKLADTDYDLLRAKLAEAIANCCEWSGNRALFGQAGAVAPLVNYLTSSDVNVHRSTSIALYQLSKDPWNCVTMHQNGVVPHLLRLIGSEDEEVQEASADCLQNIRKLALACEKFRYQHMKNKFDN
ncbi:outer dynein arm-docking complex subunit 2 [Lepeophtheirus salmonis]|nr:outer dynein arm-docking complex subunit 2-like [Lepeophtheirus salmonis]